MYANKFFLTVPFFIGSGFLSILGQSAVGSAGGDTSGPGGTVGYTVGQVAYTNFEGESGSVNQGVQQPFDIIMVSNAEPEIELNAIIYPNPTIASVQLILNEPDLSSNTGVFAYALYDPSGRLHQQHIITSATTTITLEKLVGSVYFIRISYNNVEVKTFKLFKSN